MLMSSNDVFPGQQAVLGRVYQFVAALGIIPHLPTGVGVPVASRSKYGAVISSTVRPSVSRLARNITLTLEVTQPPNIRE